MAGYSKDLILRLIGDSASAEAALKAAADAAEVAVSAYRKAQREADKQAAAAAKAAAEQQKAMQDVGRGAMVFGAVVAAGLALSTKAAIDWETAWAGVQKTVDGTPEQMAALEVELRKLATTLPATHEEIAGVAEAAGQLGIARGDIAEFTKVAIAMGVSTNLSAEEAATSMARMANIMGTSASDVDRMGSAIVAVGNAGASTEAEILDMSLRIAAAGRQAGFTEGDVFGLANAMSSLGIEAEAGGTAISLVIKKIGGAVMTGGEDLQAYADIAGTTAASFAASWRTDAAGALTTVVAGLARMQAQGENVNGVIDDLGLGGIRTSDTLLRLSGNADGLRDSLALGNRAWSENNALMNEANQRYETTASKLQTARNQITDASIDIGSFLLPVLAAGAELVADFARGFAEMPEWMKGSVTVIGVLAATIGLVGGAAMIAVPKLVTLRATMATLAGASGTATSAVGRFGTFMLGPWGVAIGVATAALGGLITFLGGSSRASEEAASYQRDLASALRESKGAIDDNVRALAAKNAAEAESDGRSLLEWAEELGVALPQVTDMLLGSRSAYETFVDAIESRIGVLDREAATLTQGSGQKAQAIANERDQLRDLLGVIDEQANAMGGAVADNERLAAATEDTGAAADGTSPAMEALGRATGEVADNSQHAADAAEKLADVLDALNGPTLGMRDATRKYQDAIDKARDSLAEHGATLDITTEAGRANSTALDRIATSAMDQANAIYNTTGSYDGFRTSLTNARQSLVDTAIGMGMTQEEAWALADSILNIPDAATVEVTLPTYGQVMAELGDVHDRIAGIPPHTWTNVGVLSEQAVQALEDIGYRTRTLPDGTIEVIADTAQAERDLNALLRSRSVVVTPYIEAVRGRGGGMGQHSLYDEPRARGGGIGPGRTFLVGEEGPELVRFGQSGWVTPADQTAQVLGALRQPTAAASPALAPATRPAGTAAGALVLDIDYRRLAAELAGVADRRPTVGQIITQRDETGYELAEKLSWDAALRPSR